MTAQAYVEGLREAIKRFVAQTKGDPVWKRFSLTGRGDTQIDERVADAVERFLLDPKVEDLCECRCNTCAGCGLPRCKCDCEAECCSECGREL